MAFAVTHIATNNTNLGGATLAVTVPVGGVPSAAIVCLGTGGPGTGSVADSKGNSYSNIASTATGAATSTLNSWYAKNVTALVSGDTITYTKGVSSTQCVMTACYITGGDTSSPLDTAVTTTANGNATDASVTGGTPGATDLQIGFALVDVALGSGDVIWTQASGWAAPPNEAFNNSGGKTATLLSVFGGNQVSGSALTFNPTRNNLTSSSWSAHIFGFKPLSSGLTFWTFPEFVDIPLPKKEVVGY